MQENSKIEDKYIKASRAAEQLAKTLIERKHQEMQDVELFLNEDNNNSKIVDRLEGRQKIETRLSEIETRREKELIRFKSKVHIIKQQQNRLKIRSIIIRLSLTAAVVLLSFVIWERISDKDSRTFIEIASNINTEIVKPTIIVKGELSGYIIEPTTNQSRNYNKMVTSDSSSIEDFAKSKFSDEEQIYCTLIVPSGYTHTVELSDGTTITVNAGGELTYPAIFDRAIHSVRLKGEAYFTVSKSNIPFVVKSDDSEIKVYGTEFNLLNCKHNGITEVVLVSGSIGFKPMGSSEVDMSPNQRIVYNKAEETVILEKDIDITDYTAWADGFFKCTNKPLANILNDIANWHNIKFIVNTDIECMIVTLNLRKDNHIDDLVGFMQKIINKEIIKKEKGVYLVQ